jgi:Ni/Fe-hydrogenase 1 B-type cytochrome subunit
MNETRRPDRYHVYVWEFPVRFFHWMNAACILVLGVTGYLIGNPPALQSTSEASGQYWFGTVRFIHFVTAYVWVFNTLIRIYWGFVGNEYIRFSHFLPYRKEQWHDILRVVRVDIVQIYKGATFSVGHNALAGAAYTVAFLALLFQAATGFATYAAMSQSWMAQSFAWIVPLMGGDHTVRVVHHMGLWFFVIFLISHVYLSAYHDYVEPTGTISSMFGGWKFLRAPRR